MGGRQSFVGFRLSHGKNSGAEDEAEPCVRHFVLLKGQFNLFKEFFEGPPHSLMLC